MSPQEERRRYGANEPLEAYSVLVALFGIAFFSLWAVGGRPKKNSRFEDAALLTIAAHKLTRIVTRDRVTAPFRAPFTRFEKSAGSGEVEEESRGEGMQKAVGHLVTCPYCVAPWVALGVRGMYQIAPTVTRLLGQALAMVAASDFLNRIYSKLED